MKFDIDQQTLDDLDVFDSHKSKKSIFRLFLPTQTIGGKEMLSKFLSKPLNDIDLIKDRQQIICFFQQSDNYIKLDKEYIDFAEYYLSQGNVPTKVLNPVQSIERKIRYRFQNSEEYYIIQRGIDALFDTIVTLYTFYKGLENKDNVPKILLNQREEFFGLFTDDDYNLISKLHIHILSNKKRIQSISATQISYFDHLFRYTKYEEVRKLINLVYEYDVYMSVAQVSKENSFSFPELDSIKSNLSIKGLFHPLLENPIPSDVELGENQNLLFVTGPNMAGKSTFLKSLALSVYLAHLGFPVPAKEMRTGLLNGLSTTINLSDDLSLGQSHFYAEVKRIKDVVSKIQKNKRMLVIFDELFRGTNVKDAFEGSLAITKALSRLRLSLFAISTHIIEVANKLEKNNNVRFCKFDVTNIDSTPQYIYKLQEGISEDRLGMYVINKEKIIETINSINE